jgi:hypothetical protein
MRCERTGAPPAGNRGPCHIYLGTHRGSEPSSPSEPSSGGGAFGANSKIARPLILGALLDATWGSVMCRVNRGKGRAGTSFFVQKMPVDPMNPKILREASCVLVRRGTDVDRIGHIGFTFPCVPTLTVISPIAFGADLRRVQ